MGGGFQMDIEGIVSKKIQAILPIYVPGRGNSTLIHGRENSITVDATIRTVIKNLCTYYHLDLKASNRYFGGFLSIGQGIPLPLTKDDVLIQIKVRRPIGEADGSMGYFNLNAIEKIEKRGKACIIFLKNGTAVPCLYTQKTIEKNMSRGRVVKKLYGERYSTIGEDIGSYMDLDAPATKGDMARLFMMIYDIVNQIK